MVTTLLVFSTQLMVFCVAETSGGQPVHPPTYYWSRTLPGLFSQRTSHIGPSPHLNSLLAEWSPWSAWTKCSRSCDTGVRLRTRHCITVSPRVMPGSGIRTSHDQCGGPSTRYDACNSRPCLDSDIHSGVSFRAAQCRQYNNKRVFGKLVTRWLPYTQGPMNPCALVCEGEGAGIVYTFGKVKDGTHCSAEHGLAGICVNGRCMRVSCDGELGGSALEDRCRVCGGNNTTCTLHKGVFHSPAFDQKIDLVNRPQTQELNIRNFASDLTQDWNYHSMARIEQGQGMSKSKDFNHDLFVADQPTSLNAKKNQRGTIGYYEVTSIPRGSTNIRVSDNSHNFLALCEDKKFLLNGNWLIDWPGEVEAGGAVFSYSRAENESEQLTALGPTKADLSLMILLREDNPGVYYEYWTPNSPPRRMSSGPPKQLQEIGAKRGMRNDPPRHQTQFHPKSSHKRLMLEKSRSSAAKSLSTFNFANESIELPSLSSRRTDAALHSTHRHSARKRSKKRHQIPELVGAESSSIESVLSSRHRSSSTVSSFTEDILEAKKIPDKKIRFSQLSKNRYKILMDLSVNDQAEGFTVRRDHGKNLKKLDITSPTIGGSNYSVRSDQSNDSQQHSRSHVSVNNLHLNTKARKHIVPVSRKRRPSKKTVQMRRKIRRKKKRRRQKNLELVCPKCSKVREVKKRFCLSDFVSRVEVLAFSSVNTENTTSSKGRYEVIIHQSFKNTVPLLHKEFVYVDNFNCSCPKLQPGKMYLIMGKTHSSGTGREVQLFLDSSSYTRRFTTRILQRVLKIRNDEMKHCKKWRPPPEIPSIVPNIDDPYLQSSYDSQPAFAELINKSVNEENPIQALTSVAIPTVHEPERKSNYSGTETSMREIRQVLSGKNLFTSKENTIDREKSRMREVDNSLGRNVFDNVKRKWHYNFRS
ncbi:Netrin module non-TIMP type [Trinorchestia longiramus]|nr:Netrin module non-TIMP type [Trinorchestia longiramus]